MNKKIWIVLVVLFFFLVVFFHSADATTVTRGPSWEESCTDVVRDGKTTHKCTRTLYSGIMYVQNSSGDWVNPSNILYITKNQDDITFHYDGIKGYMYITFEAGVIYNDNYFSI